MYKILNIIFLRNIKLLRKCLKMLYLYNKISIINSVKMKSLINLPQKVKI